MSLNRFVSILRNSGLCCAVLLALCCCGQSTQDALVGEWIKNDYDHRFFNADKTYREVYINKDTGAIDTFDLRGYYDLLGSTLVLHIQSNAHDPNTPATNPTSTVRFELKDARTLLITFQDGMVGTYLKK